MSFPAIHKALSALSTLQKEVLTQNVIILLQDLLKFLQSAIDEINEALRIDQFKQFQCKIKLCASQLTKALPILVDIMKGAQNSAHKEVSDFLIEKIRWCLLEVLRLFTGGGSNLDDGEPSGTFVKMMDDAIMTLQREGNIDSTFRATIDELLCQALTIAKLSGREDHDSIAAGCKNVLSVLSEFAVFSRTAANSFKIDALQSALEIVERRVNLAVLRLFLQIAADPHQPLKQLTLKALDKRYKPRTTNDLSSDLDLLNLYCEQIQLMGNFAVACSNDPQLKVKILSCLASIEFCENFFRSSAEEFYVTPSDYNKKGFFKFIVDEYQREMKELTLLIDLVVDTETFVMVALSDLSPLADSIKNNVENNIFHKRDAEVFLSRCARLLKHLISTNDDSIITDVQLSEAIKELETALGKYQKCLHAHILTLRSMQEMLSKIDAVIYAIQNVSCLITVGRNAHHVTNTPLNKMRIRRTTFASNVSNCSYTPDNTVLKPYLNKVLETPRKSSLYAITPKITRTVPVNTTITNITEMLENIHDLPDSFSSMKDAFEDEDASGVQTGAEFDLASLAASLSSLDTLGRLEDILLLDDKINKLKMA